MLSLRDLSNSHPTAKTTRQPEENKFLGQTFEGDYTIDPKSVVSLPCQPGEFLLFTERLIHGSEPNRSKQSRMSFVFRFIEPDTAVFRGEKRHHVMPLRKAFPLDNWACVLVHGRDTAGVNKVTTGADHSLEEIA